MDKILYSFAALFVLIIAIGACAAWVEKQSERARRNIGSIFALTILLWLVGAVIWMAAHENYGGAILAGIPILYVVALGLKKG
jgi:peptidoglycan/LPS O-acetylase OafA/YrhL